MLKSYLKAAQDDVETLLDEKRTLMDTIKSLQVKLHELALKVSLRLCFFSCLTESTNSNFATRCQEIVHGLHAMLWRRYFLKVALGG